MNRMQCCALAYSFQQVAAGISANLPQSRLLEGCDFGKRQWCEVLIFLVDWFSLLLKKNFLKKRKKLKVKKKTKKTLLLEKWIAILNYQHQWMTHEWSKWLKKHFFDSPPYECKTKGKNSDMHVHLHFNLSLFIWLFFFSYLNWHVQFAHTADKGLFFDDVPF